MLIIKWVAKSLISILLMFCVSGYVLYLSTGKTPWHLLGHHSAGSFFRSMLPTIDVADAQQAMQKGIESVEATVTQYVPSAQWGSESEPASDKQTIFRWVDEEGVTHFSETAPGGLHSEQVQLAPANVMPGQSADLASSEQENKLKALQESLERQAAERAKALKEL